MDSNDKTSKPRAEVKAAARLKDRLAKFQAQYKDADPAAFTDVTERNRIIEHLTLLDFALNQTHEAVYLSNEKYQFIYVNAEASRMLGYSREELLSMSIFDIDPDSMQGGLGQIERDSDLDRSLTFERRHKAKDGRIFPVEISGTIFEFQGKKFIVSMVRDITERKQTETLLHGLGRKLKALSRCNHMLVRAENEQALLNGICKLVCDEAGYLMAWVGFAEDDAEKTVRPVAFSGYENGYLDGIQITWADTERGQVPIGIAIRTGVAAINHDFQTYPGLAPWREAVKRRGFRSSVAVPLVSNGLVLGSLNIYSAELEAFANEEVELLQELANDIAYGVLTLRTRAEKERAEAELHLREQEFRAMIENSPDNIVRYDTQGRRIYVNPTFQASLGVSIAEILGTTLEDKSPLPDVMEYMHRMQNVFKTGCEERLEISWISPQGVERWGDVRLSPEFGKDGEVVSVLAVNRDITERKRMEQDLAQRESELRSVMESSPDTIIRYDREGRIAYLNGKLRRLLNVSAKEVIGKKPHEVWLDGRFDELEQAVIRVREMKEEARIVVQRNIEGEMRFQEIRIAPEWDNAGAVVGVIAFGRDITDLRRYELAIEESRSQLRGLAAKNEKVREEERKYIAREVHDELGQILTGLQLNISVLEHLVKRHSLPLRQHFQETKMLMDKALNVARDVATALRPAVLDMGIVSALDWLTGRYSINTGIQCEVDIIDNDIQLDENHAIAVFRIVQEALTNVSRHAKASRVYISMLKIEEEYVLKIRDNGQGFDAAVQKVDSFGIVGIRERALMLGGKVIINSSPGNGTELEVRMPVNKNARES